MRRAPRLLAVAGTLALASCGGSSDGDGAPSAAGDGPEVTRASYTKEADAYCAKANAAARKLNSRARKAVAPVHSDQQVLAALAPILTEGFEIQQRENDEFAAIPPPAQDAKFIARLAQAYSAQTTLLGLLAKAASAGDVAGFGTLSKKQDRQRARSRGLARAYGFAECGSGSNEAG